MIIGAHPHVIQDMQVMNLGDRKVSVAYSLGNVLSNMSAKNTQLGLIAWIRLTRDSMGNVEVLPLEFTYIWCSRPGGYNSRYTVLPVEEFIGTRDCWHGPWEYDKMMQTRQRIKNILDNE